MTRGTKILLVLTLYFVSDSTAQKGSKLTVPLRFVHLFDQRPLALDTVSYYTALNQPLVITKFKYYISNIQLLDVIEEKKQIRNCYLIDEEKEKSKLMVTSYQSNHHYKGIKFLIGVDSIKNCSGAQDGALDPIHGMFWTWNTGYIFLKLEGKSSASTATGQLIEYHIGGYQSPNNNIKEVNLFFDHIISAVEMQKAVIEIQVNIEVMFSTPNKIDFAKEPSVTGVSKASVIAENYKNMFQLFLKKKEIKSQN